MNCLPLALWRNWQKHRHGLFTLTVDYERSVEDLVRAGRFNDYYSDRPTTEMFPCPKHGRAKLDAKLMRNGLGDGPTFFRQLSDRDGWRLADVKEFLTFVARYPGRRGRNGVVCFGTLYAKPGESPRVYYGWPYFAPWGYLVEYQVEDYYRALHLEYQWEVNPLIGTYVLLVRDMA
jgi:hypothetical protein